MTLAILIDITQRNKNVIKGKPIKNTLETNDNLEIIS